MAIRTVGEKHEPAVFFAWSAKVFALIRTMCDTMMDRLIVVEMHG